MRGLHVVLLTAALLVGAAAPAAPPEYPVAFVGVDVVKALLDGQSTVDIIDVRTRPEYDELHITGARSIPLRSLPERTRDIPRDRLVVLY